MLTYYMGIRTWHLLPLPFICGDPIRYTPQRKGDYCYSVAAIVADEYDIAILMKNSRGRQIAPPGHCWDAKSTANQWILISEIVNIKNLLRASPLPSGKIPNQFTAIMTTLLREIMRSSSRYPTERERSRLTKHLLFPGCEVNTLFSSCQ